MNAYRIALILCRAVALALWWSAGLRLASVLLTYVVGLTGVYGTGFPAWPLSLQSLMSVVALSVVAGFLQLFAASLAASMVGGGSFAGESLGARRVLEAPERILAGAGAGLFLLFFGAASALPLMVTALFGLLGGEFAGTASSFMLYNLVSGFVPAALQCFVGLMLAFLPGLRRIVQTP